MRILIAGFQHETNTFAPSKATWASFVAGESFPAMRHGADVLGFAGVNIPIGGFIDAMKAHPEHELVPVVWTGATPSAHVTEDAFERIAALIVDGAKAAKPDAVYLDLHGAAVAEHIDDCEGEILTRLRALLGPDVPIVASLDLHANVSEAMLEAADALVTYRTYPHVDMAKSGAMSAQLLLARLDGAPRLAMATRRLPFLIAINAMCTDLEPAGTLYRSLPARESANVPHVSVALGFPAADIRDCGPRVWAYGTTQAAANVAADSVYETIAGQEADWDFELLEPSEAVARAQKIAKTAQKPVVIADTQDNCGAGADSNTTGMLRALIDAKAEGAAIGLMVDPDAALKAHAAGEGASITLALGGRSGTPGDAPFEGTFKVERLASGKVQLKGPMMRGAPVDLGPCALLSIHGIKIVCASQKVQMLDRELYRFIGVEPEAQKILVNKSSVHFRADFTPIAEAILVARAPGPMAADPAALPFTRLPIDLRLRPNGPVQAQKAGKL